MHRHQFLYTTNGASVVFTTINSITLRPVRMLYLQPSILLHYDRWVCCIYNHQFYYNTTGESVVFTTINSITLLPVLVLYLQQLIPLHCGPDSSVGIATELRAGRSGDRIPVGARFSAPVQTGPGVHPASCTMGAGSFPGVESGRGVTLTPHPLLVPRSKNRVELYLYSP
jgi:hypothetical protein